MVTHINYNGGKQVDYAYNAVGDLVRMEDWTGVNTFEYDLLSQLKKVTDHKGNVVKYDYDGNGSINNPTKLVENGDHVRLYYHMDYLGSADYLTSDYFFI